MARSRAIEVEEEAAAVPGTQALTRGIALLGLVADAPAPLRFAEIADRAGLARPTAHRILAALVEARLLRHEPSSQTYALGSRFLEMAHRVWDGFDLRATAAPELERLARLAGETARLAVLDGDGVLYVDQREAEQEAVRLVNRVGARALPHASACGKAMLAQLPAAERQALLEALSPLAAPGPRTVTDVAALERDLSLSAVRGYALSLQEAAAGVNGVAAAVLDRRARPLGAICLVGPAFRLDEPRLHALGREVMEAARRISGNAAQSAMTLTVAPRPSTVSEGVRLAVRAEALLGEGPLWHQGRLHWVDILAPAVHVSDPESGTDQVIPVEELVASLAPRRDGGLVAASRSGLRLLDGSGLGRVLAAPIAEGAALRLNDGKCDRAGRFWVGSLALDSTPDAGALHRIGADGTARVMQAGLHVANGIGFSPDDARLYLADSGRRRIDVFDFDLAAGTLANRRPFVSFAEGEGVPDGLTVDAAGGVWVALWDGWRVARYTPDGRLDRVLNLPVPRPTSCAFGGPGLATLFVTSARVRLSAAELAEAPLSGSVFAIETGGAHGLPEPPFHG
ncbi:MULTISPECIES: SMP-30/gluconolactonase/LRE family protein [Roseomonadaceae]|uniref:SMP-30/gluconolactonase/LRE family protein n=1 Tax=Falsiroseomonas oleicola TaxID=2801474 RepID=A0ABS6HCM2_9PROT|nr:SMP-30/gluconolactonase/LRE family protein [Roseomonas oleicola]MBU8545065.1 SMP-30/gluconolactonase/LRE family protein [Roseomonas oleicola]